MKKLWLIISFSFIYFSVTFAQDKRNVPHPVPMPTATDTARGKHAVKANKSAEKRVVKKRTTVKTKSVAITHNAPGQQQLDSIKNAKTRLKK